MGYASRATSGSMATSRAVKLIGRGPLASLVRRRPFGIYVIVVLFLLHVASIFTDVLRLRFGLPSLILPEVEGEWATIINQAVAVVLLVTALGLSLLKRWAWIVTMLVTGIGLAYGIVLYWRGTPLYTGMVINVLIVFYLNQRAVQRAFERREPTEQRA
jgi:hypothetical protein